MQRWATGLALASSLAALAAAPTIKAVIYQRAGTAAGESSLVIRLLPTELTVGSYQGVLRFTPGTLSILSGKTPPNDGSRFLNLADSLKGVIRFAGFTVSGFTSQDVLTLAVRPKGKIDAANLVVELEVAADLTGIPVAKDRLIPARGITTER